jgi:hypothetical protein
MIGSSKLKSRACDFNGSIASGGTLAIQKRHFDDLQLVAKQAEGRSGVFCCSVRILLLPIVRLLDFSDNTLFLYPFKIL